MTTAATTRQSCRRCRSSAGAGGGGVTRLRLLLDGKARFAQEFLRCGEVLLGNADSERPGGPEQKVGQGHARWPGNARDACGLEQTPRPVGLPPREQGHLAHHVRRQDAPFRRALRREAESPARLRTAGGYGAPVSSLGADLVRALEPANPAVAGRLLELEAGRHESGRPRRELSHSFCGGIEVLSATFLRTRCAVRRPRWYSV
jgi:hypothetical protein